MAIATCVFTCKSWFCMSRMTCLIIFSGCSARSIRSLRLARTKVDTRSSNAIGDSFHDHVRTAAPLQFTQGRLSAVQPNEARRLTADSSRTEVHSERQFRKKISCGAAKSRALSKQFSVEAWLKPCPPDLASRSCTGETPAPTSRIGRPLHTQLLSCSRTFARRRQSIRRLRAFVTNRSDLGKQLAHAHAR